MTYGQILDLLTEWETLRLSKPEDRAPDFEQKRLQVIEDIAQAFVDYYNANELSKPYSLSLVRHVDEPAA